MYKMYIQRPFVRYDQVSREQYMMLLRSSWVELQNHQNTFEATSTTILHGLQKNAKTRKNLEASYISLWKPDLNEQKDFERLLLFRNGVT